PDGKHLISTTDQVHLWDVRARRELRRFAPRPRWVEYFVRIALSPDGKTFATGCDHIYLWDFATGKVRHTLPNSALPYNNYCGLIFSADGKTLISSSEDEQPLRKW